MNRIDCNGCPHHRPNDIDDCAAGMHTPCGDCVFEMLLEDFEDFQRWKYNSAQTDCEKTTDSPKSGSEWRNKRVK